MSGIPQRRMPLPIKTRLQTNIDQGLREQVHALQQLRHAVSAAYTRLQNLQGTDQAITSGVEQILADQAEVVIAGGTDCISDAPILFNKPMRKKLMAAQKLKSPGEYLKFATTLGLKDFVPEAPAVAEYTTGRTMGMDCELLAARYGVTREEQDEFAVKSQNKAEAAIQVGRFKDEIFPLSIPQRKGDPLVFDTDEFPRLGATLDNMTALKPAFKKDGSVTAANASGLNDGAAAVMLMSAAKAKELGLPVLAKIQAYASAGLDPTIMGMGPVPASKKCLEKAGWSASELDLMEINEAFAAQACAVNKEMGWDTSKINVNGGAIALGHPIGASGCRVLVSLIHEMNKRDAKKGLASLCIGGGMGVALAVSR